MVGREFQMWDYSVSHSRLLIRSPRNREYDVVDNVDIIFVSIQEMSIKPFIGKIYGIEIIDKVDTYHKRYRLDCQHSIFHIVALHCSVYRTRMDIFESMLDRF